MDTDVLIVGAGPTGLMLANQLARRGVRVAVVDRHAGPARETRALGVQARTLEIYAQLGIVARALELGRIATGANLWAQGRKTARVPLGEAGRGLTPYPYILILGQDDNERIMGDKLREAGVAVQWNTELVALAQAADKVTATLRQPDGSSRQVEAAWVGGCDGAHSAVRELNAIAFPGAPYEHVFYVADTEATGSMVAGEVNVYLWRTGFHLLFPMRGKDHWRIVGILPPGLRDSKHASIDDVLPSLRAEAGAGLAIKACSWFSTYRIHHRAAQRFRDRRCFLLGDAAHIHSPVGAQGMNTGLQDAYNLAWKLALVAQGRAHAGVARHLRGGAHARRAAPARHHRPRLPAGRLRQLARRPACAPRSSPASPPLPWRASASSASRFAPSPRSASTTAPARSPHPSPACPTPRPAPATAFPGCACKLEPDGPVEDLFAQARRHSSSICS